MTNTPVRGVQPPPHPGLRALERRWTIWRDAPGFFQRYTATISDDGRTISGAWEQSPDGRTWALDFHMNYLRHEP